MGVATSFFSLSLALRRGFYCLDLKTLSQLLRKEGFNEASQGLPLIMADSNFRVMDGFANDQGNILLAAFRGTKSAAITEAATPTLFRLGLAGLGFARRL